MNRALNNEIIPVIKGVDRKELEEFAASVTDRFANPFIDHELLSISLNSAAKWKARIMPTLLDYYEQRKELPKVLTFSFAAFLCFYHCGRENTGGALKGYRDGEKFFIRDDEWILEEFLKLKDEPDEVLAETIINNENMWGGSLKKTEGFLREVIADLKLIKEKGMYEAMREIQKEDRVGHDQDTSK